MWEESAMAAVTDDEGIYAADHGHKNTKKVFASTGMHMQALLLGSYTAATRQL